MSDDGDSLILENIFTFPDECLVADEMYVDPDGQSLTFIVEGFLYFHHEAGSVAGCKLDAKTGALITVAHWGDDFPGTRELDAVAQDPQTGDVYILGGSDGSMPFLSVLRLGADITQTFPRPEDQGASCPCFDGPGTLVLDSDFAYVVYNSGIYRYSTHDLSAPALAWAEKDLKTWHPIALVRTTDHQYWWIVEEQKIDAYYLEGNSLFSKDGMRYRLYSDSFDKKLTSVYGVQYARHYFPSNEGHFLLIGQGQTYQVNHSYRIRTDFYASTTMVDPALPRSLSMLWNWWYFAGFAGFSLVGLLSARGVRRRETRVADCTNSDPDLRQDDRCGARAERRV